MPEPGPHDSIEERIAHAREAVSRLRKAGFSPAMLEPIEQLALITEALDREVQSLRVRVGHLWGHSSIRSYLDLVNAFFVVMHQVLKLTDKDEDRAQITDAFEALHAALKAE